MSSIDKTEDVQAFPCSNTYSYYGMSLRDYFAGQALSILANSDYKRSYEDEALEAYSLADAMIKERDK